MADEQDKEDKFDFTSEGEALGYISLAQARMLAMQTAREMPGDYGRRLRGINMAFEVVESAEDEDYYNVTLSFRPQGQFTGTPGQEQFFLEKEGSIAHRQVLSLPMATGGRRFPAIPIFIGLLVVGTGAVVGALVVGGGIFSDGKGSIPIGAETPSDTPPSNSIPDRV